MPLNLSKTVLVYFTHKTNLSFFFNDISGYRIKKERAICDLGILRLQCSDFQVSEHVIYVASNVGRNLNLDMWIGRYFIMTSALVQLCTSGWFEVILSMPSLFGIGPVIHRCSSRGTMDGVKVSETRWSGSTWQVKLRAA